MLVSFFPLKIHETKEVGHALDSSLLWPEHIWCKTRCWSLPPILGVNCARGRRSRGGGWGEWSRAVGGKGEVFNKNFRWKFFYESCHLMNVFYLRKLSTDESFILMKVALWWKLCIDESLSSLRSDSLWCFKFYLKVKEAIDLAGQKSAAGRVKAVEALCTGENKSQLPSLTFQ